MSLNPSISLFSQPLSPLSPPESEHLFALDGIKGDQDFTTTTTFPPSPPASLSSTSPPAVRSSVSSVEDFELESAFAPAAVTASALSGQYLARYLHYRHLALLGAESDQEVSNILSAYAIDPAQPPAVSTGPFSSISSMEQIYRPTFPVTAPIDHRQTFHGLQSHHSISVGLGDSRLAGFGPLLPLSDSQHCTPLQPTPMLVAPGYVYPSFYTAAGQHANTGLQWSPLAYKSPASQDSLSFPAVADANAIATGRQIQLRLPKQVESVATNSTSVSVAGEEQSLGGSEDEATDRSSRESSTAALISVESVPNMNGGGRGYVPGSTPEDPKKRHKCEVCSRGFARAFNLKSHAQTHNPERPKPHMCPHAACKRGFSRLHDLERHRQGIHADGPLIDAKRQGIAPSVARAQSRIQRRAERGNLI